MQTCKTGSQAELVFENCCVLQRVRVQHFFTNGLLSSSATTASTVLLFLVLHKTERQQRGVVWPPKPRMPISWWYTTLWVLSASYHIGTSVSASNSEISFPVRGVEVMAAELHVSCSHHGGARLRQRPLLELAAQFWQNNSHV